MSVLIEAQGGMQLLAGLYWDKVNADSSRKEIKNFIEEQAVEYEKIYEKRPSIGCVQSLEGTLQTGVGDEIENRDYTFDKKSVVRSLAALAQVRFATQVSLIGRMALTEELHWVFVCRSGYITPLGDLIVPVEESDAVFAKTLENNEDLEVRFNTLDVGEAQETINAWISEVKRARKLGRVIPIGKVGAPVINKRQLYFLGCLAIIICGSAFTGYTFINNYLEQKEAQKLAEQRRLDERMNRVGPPPRPWQHFPLVSSVVNACWENYENRVVYKNGWEAGPWECDGKTIKQTWWRSEVGTFNALPVNYGFSVTDPNQLVETLDIDDLGERGLTPLVLKEPAAKLLMDLARMNDMSIKITWGREETREVRKKQEIITEKLGFALNKVSLQTDKQPSAHVFEVMSKIPSLHIAKISDKGGDWDVKVEFYTAVKG